MTEEEINLFEKIQTQIEGLHDEISALSKKAQNDTINKFKLKFINEILSQANSLLIGYYKPFADFDLFNDTDLPTNSDVVFILKQYINCMETLRSDNIAINFVTWYWLIDNSISEIRTTAPEKIFRKNK